MKTVAVHLRGNHRPLVWDLEDKVAADVRDLVLAMWARGDADQQLQGAPLAFGEGSELTAWVKASEIVAIEVHPVDEGSEP